MKKTIILSEQQLRGIYLIEAFNQTFKDNGGQRYTNTDMLNAYKKLSPQAYTDKQLEQLADALRNGDTSVQVEYQQCMDNDMKSIEKLCGNLLEKITHNRMFANAWYMEPGYVTKLLNQKDLSHTQFKIFDSEQSFYQMILALYQNKTLWNNLFFDPHYANVKHLYNLCIQIAKGKLPKIANRIMKVVSNGQITTQPANDLDTLNSVIDRRNDDYMKINGKPGTLKHYDSPVDVKTYGKAIQELIPQKEIAEMTAFRKNPQNAEPALFYHEVDTDDDDWGEL